LYHSPVQGKHLMQLLKTHELLKRAGLK